MAQAGPHVEQHFGNTEASHGGLLFQGHVSGPLHIHQHATDTAPRFLERLDSLPEASFDAANKQHVATCLPNTRCDVLAQIRRWVDGDGGQRIYWLKGWAGTGKSTIALTVAREYSGKKRLGASFFFSRSGGDLASTRRFAATIAVQLAESSPELHERISNAVASRPSIRGLGLYDQWKSLVLEPLAHLGGEAFSQPLVIVVDALDECDNKDDVSLLVRCLAAAVTVEQVDLRIFVTSRPDQPMNVSFDGISTDAHQDFILHDIKQSIVNHDLAVYYKHQLGQLARASRLDAAFFSDENIQTLVQKSCRLFIYAATVCRFVHDGEPFAGKRLAHIVSAERLPTRAGAELDRMYMTVLEYSLTAKLDPEETERIRELFRRVVGTIVVLFDALSPTSLAMLLDQSKETIALPLSSLHSLLDVPEEEDRLIRLLHPSFREFLLDAQRCTHAMFCIDAKKAHRHLFDCCLRIMAGYLRQDMCDLGRPGMRVGDIPRSDVNKKVPFAVQYACRYWAYHLERSDVDPQGHGGIAEFFETRFLFWLETLALIGRLADGIAMLQLLESRLPRSTTTGFRGSFSKMMATLVPRRGQNPSILRAVVYDAKRFLRSHSSIIEEAPLQVYCSALVFSPEASIIRQLYIHQLPKWIVRAPALSEDWSVHLQTLSHPSAVSAVAFSPDGRLIVSGSDDNTVRVWDAATGAERHVLRGHSRWVSAVAFSLHGRRAACATRPFGLGQRRRLLATRPAHCIGLRRRHGPGIGCGDRRRAACATRPFVLGQGRRLLAGRPTHRIGLRRRDGPGMGCGDGRRAACATRPFGLGQRGRLLPGRPAHHIGLRRQDGPGMGCSDGRRAACATRPFALGQRGRLLAGRPAHRIGLRRRQGPGMGCGNGRRAACATRPKPKPHPTVSLLILLWYTCRY